MDLKASLLQNYRKITSPHLITKRTKNKPLKKPSTTPPETKTRNHFVEKRERITSPAEISCGADNSGTEVRKN